MHALMSFFKVLPTRFPPFVLCDIGICTFLGNITSSALMLGGVYFGVSVFLDSFIVYGFCTKALASFVSFAKSLFFPPFQFIFHSTFGSNSTKRIGLGSSFLGIS